MWVAVRGVPSAGGRAVALEKRLALVSSGPLGGRAGQVGVFERVVHGGAPFDRAPPQRGAPSATTAGRRSPCRVARSKACASWSTPHSSRCRPTICTPTGSPPAVNPPGTEIAGFAISDTYQHDRIQSTYVAIGASPIRVGYGVATSNGATCVTGSTK